MRNRSWFMHLLVWVMVAGTLHAQDSIGVRCVRLLVFGDVNLGRTVGQKILQGDLDYPFALVRDTLRQADVVFVNLESQLTNQGGETQHPQFNLIFCGPAEGASTLQRANITVVSTANNHAFDYGLKGLSETVQNLRTAGIAFTGTSEDSVQEFLPAIVTFDSVRIGFVAYTQFVNLKGPWRGRIASFAEERARREISSLRQAVDFVVASYHGGPEYVDRPPEFVHQHMRTLIDAGAHIVFGHHPHYVQGIERYGGGLIFHSLGNFVFYQPQRDWTQKGLGVELQLGKGAEGTVLESVRLLPVRAGLQPSFSLSPDERQALLERIRRLSTVELQEINGSWFIQKDTSSTKD